MFLCFDNRFRQVDSHPGTNNYYEYLVPLIKSPGSSEITMLPIISLSDGFFHGFHINDLMFYPRRDATWFKEHEQSLLTKSVHTFVTEHKPTFLYVCMKTRHVNETNVAVKLPKSVRTWLSGL